MSRWGADRPVRAFADAFAAIVAVAVTTTIVALSLGLLAVRFVGLNAYVVQGGPTESMVPIGSLVVTVPASSDPLAIDEDNGESSQAPKIGTAWVAIPTLGYAVNYAEAYSPPIFIGLVVWMLVVIAVRALAPYMSTSRRRVPA